MDPIQEILAKIAELAAQGEARAAEVAALRQELAQVQARNSRPNVGGGAPVDTSVGRKFVESPQFKRMIEGGGRNCDPVEIDAKAFRAAMRATSLSSSNVGALVDNPLLPTFSPIAKRTPILKGLMRVSPVSTDTVRYTRESGFYDIYTEVALSAASGQKVIKVKYAGGFKPGSTIEVGSGGSAESKVIDTIDYDKNEITVTVNLTGTHAAGAKVSSDDFIFTEETELAPRAKWDIEEASTSVKNLQVGVVVSSQVTDDAPRLAALINDRLPAAMARNEESQILNGDDSAKQLPGILNNADLQTLTWSSQNAGTTKIDCVRLASHLAIAAHYPPNAVLLNPQECRDIDLLKDDEGRYILAAGPLSEGVPRLWRLNVVESLAIAAGTALVGSFDQALTLYEREGVSIRIFEQHEDLAERGMVYVRAEMREALAVERGESFVKIDFDAAP